MKKCDTCIYRNNVEQLKPCIIYRDDCEYYEKERGDMTNEQAKAEIMQIYGVLSPNKQQALDVAIKALEQEPIAQERYEDLCEYFGGVEDFLKNRDDFKAWLERVKWHIHKAEELYEKYEQEPCGETVSLEAFKQVMWERDIAIEQLKELGYGFGQKIEPKTGHWIKYSIPRCGEQHYACTLCGYYINFGQWGELYTKEFKYCPNCGARMESEEV